MPINIIGSASNDDIMIYFNDVIVKTDVPAEISDGRTMIPLRALSDSFGAMVSWDGNTNEVTVQTENSTTVLAIGNNTAQIDGVAVVLDAPPYIKNGRTMVPLRFLVESLGLSVNWDASKRIVYIKTVNAVTPLANSETPRLKLNQGIYNMGQFTNGLAAVIRDGKLGYINIDGNVVIDFQFDCETNYTDMDKPDFIFQPPAPYAQFIMSPDDFSFTKYGYAFVKLGGEYFYIDKHGKKIDNTFDGKYYYAGPFVNGRAAAQKVKNGPFGYIDENGNEVTEFKYLSASNFKDGVARVIEAVPFKNGNSRFEPPEPQGFPYFVGSYDSKYPLRDKYMPKDKDVIDVYIDTQGSVLSWKFHEQNGLDFYFRTGVIFELDEVSEGLILNTLYNGLGNSTFWYTNPDGTTAIEFRPEQRVIMAEPFNELKIAAIVYKEGESMVSGYINNRGEILNNAELALKHPNLFRTIKSDSYNDEGIGLGSHIVVKNGAKYIKDGRDFDIEIDITKFQKKFYFVDADGRIISDCTEQVLNEMARVYSVFYNCEISEAQSGITNPNNIGISVGKEFNSNVYYIYCMRSIHSRTERAAFFTVEGWKE